MAEDARDLVATITDAGRDLEGKAAAVPGAVAPCYGDFERFVELKELLVGLMGEFAERRKAAGK